MLCQVACSIPGYTFSSAPKKSPLQLETIARCFNSVMQHLGYEKYVVQGGDVSFSSSCVTKLTRLVVGFHHQPGYRALSPRQLQSHASELCEWL